MRALHWLTRVFLLAVTVVVALAVADSALRAESWKAALALLEAHPWEALSGASAVLLLVALHLLSGLRRPRHKTAFISFDTPTGTVTISVKAVKDFIRKTGEEFGAVLDLYPDLRSQGGEVDVTVDARVYVGTHLPELCRLLQERIADRLRDQLGLEKIKAVRVNIRDLVNAPPLAGTRNSEHSTGT